MGPTPFIPFSVYPHLYSSLLPLPLHVLHAFEQLCRFPHPSQSRVPLVRSLAEPRLIFLEVVPVVS